MRITPNKEDFVNDMLIVSIGDNRTFVVNSINESFPYSDTTIEVKGCNLHIEEAVADGTASVTACPNIIGIASSVMQITSADPSLYGEVLTEDNIQFCVLEIHE